MSSRSSKVFAASLNQLVMACLLSHRVSSSIARVTMRIRSPFKVSGSGTAIPSFLRTRWLAGILCPEQEAPPHGPQISFLQTYMQHFKETNTVKALLPTATCSTPVLVNVQSIRGGDVHTGPMVPLLAMVALDHESTTPWFPTHTVLILVPFPILHWQCVSPTGCALNAVIQAGTVCPCKASSYHGG